MTTPYLSSFGIDLHDTDRFDAAMTADEMDAAWLGDFFALPLDRQERAYRIATPEERDLIDRVRAVETTAVLLGIDELADDLRTERSVA